MGEITGNEPGAKAVLPEPCSVQKAVSHQVNNHVQIHLIAMLTCLALPSLALAQAKSKPAFQYQSGDIRVSIPTADEPRVKQFGPASLKLAATTLLAVTPCSSATACQP